MPLKLAFSGVRLERWKRRAKRRCAARASSRSSEIAETSPFPTVAPRISAASRRCAALRRVLARGVAKLATLAELTLPFLRVGGRARRPQVASVDVEMDAASAAVSALGGAAPKR